MTQRPDSAPSFSGRERSLEDMKRLCMDNLLHNPEERVYFKDLDSRFLFVSQGFVDGEAPGMSASEVIGKTDFDIFSEMHAVTAFEDEQHIIRTGEPVLAKIER